MTNNCQLSRTVNIDKSLSNIFIILKKSVAVAMADYPWPDYYYGDYDYLDTLSRKGTTITEPRQEKKLEFVLAIALPIVFILGFIG
jgi:hypothetical protein